MKIKIKILMVIVIALLALGINSKVHGVSISINKNTTAKSQKTVVLSANVSAKAYNPYTEEVIVGYAWSDNATPPTLWKNYNSTYTVKKNGTYCLFVKSKLNVSGSNYVITKKSVTVTNIAPSFTINKSTSSYATSVKLTCGFTSGTVGNGQKITYKWSNVYSTSLSNQSSYTANSNGTYYLTITDQYGNTRTSSVTINNIDKSAPKISSLKANTTSWTKSNVTLTGEAQDTSSGIKYYQFSQSANITASSSGWTSITATKSKIKHKKTISENGTWYYYTKDVAGNVSYKKISVTNIDKSAPTISTTRSASTWTSSNVKITATLKDTGSGIRYYKWSTDSSWTGVASSSTGYPHSKTITKTVSSSGTTSLTLYVKDVTGNQTSSTVKTYIDKTKPTLIVKASTKAATNGNVTATITAKDTGGSGIGTYSFDEKKTWTTSNTKTITANGTYNCYVKDKAGNVSSVATLKVTNIDKKAPTISSLKANTTAWTKSNVTLTGEAQDTSSGIKYYQFSQSSKITSSSSGWTSITATKSKIKHKKTISKNGTWYYYTKDVAGNVSYKKISVTNIDKSAPKISSLKANTTSWTKSNVTLTGESQDTSSGIKYYQFSQSSKITSSSSGWTSITATKSKIKHTKAISENGTWYYYIKDVAGNVSYKKISVRNIDKTAPKVTYTLSTTKITKKPVTITISATDKESGLAANSYSWDNNNYTSTPTKTVTKNGVYTIYVKDNVGNITKQSITVSNIDNTIDSLIVTYSTKAATTGSVVVTINSTENELKTLNGWKLSTDKMSLSKTFTKNFTANLTIEDVAGNKFIATVSVTNIYIRGDINQDEVIDVTDLTILKRYIISKITLYDIQLVAADISKDEKVDVTDLLLLKRHIVSGNKKEWKIK